MEAVTVQHARLWLAARIRELDPRWTVTTRTLPELKATYTVQIGHAPPVGDTFASSAVELPVAWWVNEGNSRAAVAKLYDDLSNLPESLVRKLRDETPGIKRVEITGVGAQVEGPTGWLRAVSVVRVRLADIPTEQLPNPNEDDEES